MQPQLLVGEVLSGIVARVGHSASGEVRGSLLTLASMLLVLVVGGATVRLLSRLTRRSTPELIVLLNQSAAFYRRFPEDQHLNAPPRELLAETARCQRIIELLEQRAAAENDQTLASRGPIDGLRAWIALLNNQIEAPDATPSGSAFA